MKELREIKAKLLSDKKALGLIVIFLLGLSLLFISGTSSGKTKTQPKKRTAEGARSKESSSSAPKGSFREWRAWER